MKKLTKKKGFTLTEMLVALLIMILLTGVIMIGIQAGSEIYRNSLFESESETMASTVNMALSDILRYASCGSTQTPVSFTNSGYDIQSGHFLTEDGRIYITERSEEDEGKLALLNEKSYSSLKIQDFSIQYDDNVYTGSYIITDKNKKNTKTVNFTFRTLE